MLLCQKIKENLIPHDITPLNKCTNTGRHSVVVEHVVSESNFLSLIFPLIFHFLFVVLQALPLSLSLFATHVFSNTLFFLLDSVLSFYSVTLFSTLPAISVNLLSRSRHLFLRFSLPSITLMNSDGGSRVMAGVVSANASSLFWQIAPINLIYHYFPSSFNKFLWAFPPLMTRCLRRGLAALRHPRGPARHYSGAQAADHMLLRAHYCFSINVHTRGRITRQGELCWC